MSDHRRTGQPGPEAAAYVPQASPDGARINTPTGWLIDAMGNRFSLVRTVGKGMQIKINAFIDGITQNVLALQMQGGVCLQETSAPAWYAYGGQPGNWTETTAPPDSGGGGGPTPPPVSGGIRVRGGRFIDEAGNDVHLHGPNIRALNWPDNQNMILNTPIADRPSCTPLVNVFPGTNCIRFDAFESMAQIGAASPDKLIPYIDSIVRQGIFAEVECHVYPTLLTGSNLDQVCQWYAQLATHYRDEPKVIWGTQNEPDGNPDDEISRIYDAIRGAGNGNVILACPEGGWSYQNMNPANYRRYENLAFDYHYYGWMNGYSMDPNTIDQDLHGRYENSKQFQTKDGDMPFVVGEFSPCGFQNTNAIFVENQFWIDPNGMLVIDAVYRAKFLSGWLQWLWNEQHTSQPNGIGHLIRPDGNFNGSVLTEHGGIQLRDALAAYR